MATPFKDIYDRAIFRFADYDFLKRDIETREDVLEKYLISAKTDFQRLCKKNLGDCNYETKEFTETLDDEIIEILSLGIAFYWLSYKTLNSRLLKNVLSSKDYQYYSPANLLKEVRTLRETVEAEFYGRMKQYSYNDNTISTLRP